MKKRKKLQEFRKNKKITQSEMALRLGLSLIQYQFIENGYRNPSIKVLEKFKNVFPEANIDELFLTLNFTQSKY